MIIDRYPRPANLFAQSSDPILQELDGILEDPGGFGWCGAI
jgi:hypothetical protein